MWPGGRLQPAGSRTLNRSVRARSYRFDIVIGVFVLGSALVISVMLCSVVRAKLPVAFLALAVAVGLTLSAAGFDLAESILLGGVFLLAGLVFATFAETREETRLARRRARPRRRPRVREAESALDAEAEPDRERRAA